MHSTRRRPQPETGGEDQDRALRNAIEAAYQGTRHLRRPALRRPPQAPELGGSPSRSQCPVAESGRVASAELVAHRDTWEWLAALAVDHSHFRTPPCVQDIKEGRVQTVLSGRSLITLLIDWSSTRSTATPLQGD